jgi:hypothetical protein
MTDFVSPLWIGLGIVGPALALTCAVVVYLHWPYTLGIFPTSAASVAVLADGPQAIGDVRPRGPVHVASGTFRVRQRH